VDDLSMSQPQVSKHLRVLGEVGLVRAGAGASPFVPPGTRATSAVARLVAKYEQAMNDRLDRMDDYLNELQRQGERNDTSSA